MKLALVVPRYGAEIVGGAETLVRRFARRLPRPEFDVTIFLIFAPYPAGTTFYGTTWWPERTWLWPCLYDESFAHFWQTGMLSDACRGVIFLTEPEQLGRSGTPMCSRPIIGWRRSIVFARRFKPGEAVSI